jgi:copper homeostasis protein
MTFLEIAIFNPASALVAYTSGGADRLELCADGSSINGGTTPTLATLESVIGSLSSSPHHRGQWRNSIPIYTMVRPRGGDFVYSDEEFEVMKQQLRELKQADYSSRSNYGFGKVSGLVFGILTRDGKVDKPRNEELVRLAAPLPCTFHRAFDQVIQAGNHCGQNGISEQVRHELENVIDAGFAAILTSGGEETAVDGAKIIAALTTAADGRITIIAGGGVRSGNVHELRKKTGTLVFHSSAVLERGSDLASPEEVRALKRELLT